MRQFGRAVLLFLQCLITWPWAILLAAIFVLEARWRLRNNPSEWRAYWSDMKIIIRTDWRTRLYWVRLGARS